ncbi:ionic transporter y4hA [Pedobacter sp. JY14-1]|uniref:calcium:proton antiporter n=1 Tax=Pedobacter sp. JY14-1 TaxID=3034151 RepID=UPI0023E1B72F|nr:ionic transporter y4hA [Pedobacter sp. JY14-1]
MTQPGLPKWTIIAPIAAWISFALLQFNLGDAYKIILVFTLISSVLAAVHHAEVVAHYVGEPFGTLILALAITVIEVALIVSLMLSGGEETLSLARDTVLAAVMIILTGIIGLCICAGAARFKEQRFTLQGTGSALIALNAILVLTLILPNYTTSEQGPVYSSGQLIFVSVISLVIYGTFVFVQSVRHRDYFLPQDAENEESHAPQPSGKTALSSLVLLVFCLAIVVLLAKKLSPDIEGIVLRIGAPESLVGVIIALVVLLPEGMAAFKAARKNRLQTSLNLALGSALASIGLTIPAVAVVSVITGLKITLGIDSKALVLLILSQFTVMWALATGKTNILQGVVLMVIFFAYLFTIIAP